MIKRGARRPVGKSPRKSPEDRPCSFLRCFLASPIDSESPSRRNSSRVTDVEESCRLKWLSSLSNRRNSVRWSTSFAELDPGWLIKKSASPVARSDRHGDVDVHESRCSAICHSIFS